MLKLHLYPKIIVIPNEEFFTQSNLSNEFGFILNKEKFKPLTQFDKNEFGASYYTTDLDHALHMSNQNENLTIWIYNQNDSKSHTYDIKIQKINVRNLYIYGINKPTIRIHNMVEINSRIFIMKNLILTYLPDNKNVYHSKEYYSTSVFYIRNEEYLKISKCVFNGFYDYTYFKEVDFIHLHRKYSDQVFIHKNEFNRSFINLEFIIGLSLKNNKFNNSRTNLRLSSGIITRNEFVGYSNLDAFKCNQIMICLNRFNQVFSKFYILSIDYGTNCQIIQNNFDIMGNSKLIHVDRSSTVELVKNHIGTSDLGTIDFYGKLVMDANTFNITKICYDLSGPIINKYLIEINPSYTLDGKLIELFNNKPPVLSKETNQMEITETNDESPKTINDENMMDKL
jgi:hypothetical protein